MSKKKTMREIYELESELEQVEFHLRNHSSIEKQSTIERWEGYRDALKWVLLYPFEFGKLKGGEGKMKYFIVWGDYDHDDVMEIENKEVAEEEIAKIQAKIDLEDNYGTYLTMVIKGKQIEYDTVEVASKCVLRGE